MRTFECYDAVNKSWTLRQEDAEQYKYLGIFIETGTYRGGGIAQAIRTGFTEIHSIEIDDKHFNDAVVRFKDNKDVFLYHGDAKDIFPALIKKITRPALIFLDSHTKVCGSNERPPLMDELSSLLDIDIPHVIVIDDVDLILKRIEWGRGISIEEFNGIINLFIEKYNIDKHTPEQNRPDAQWWLIPKT